MKNIDARNQNAITAFSEAALIPKRCRSLMPQDQSRRTAPSNKTGIGRESRATQSRSRSTDGLQL